MDFLSSSTHLHITAWALALILFFVAALAGKKLTAVHMTLRVMYILVIITGLALFLEWRDKIAVNMFWVLFVIVLLITLYLGMSMGIGINF